MIRRLISPFLPLAALAFAMAAAEARAQAVFDPPARIAAAPGRDYQISRTASAAAAFDAQGALHVVYWAGGQATSPAAPSYVLYRSWTPRGGWTDEEIIDDSYAGATRLGGRHPSLAFGPAGEIWVAWHDYRHATAAGNWMDNTEIYADRRPAGGAFSALDLRLTATAAGGLGDNGFAPKLAAGPDGRIHLAWYDFHYYGTVSDLFLKTTDGAGEFNLAETMDAMRLTRATDRSGAPAFTLPALAVAADGARHLVWVGGTTDGADLYYGEAAPGGGGGADAFTPRRLLAHATSFFDPPQIATGPGEGEVWIAFADRVDPQNPRVKLLHRPAGAAEFEAPREVDPGPAAQSCAAIAVSPEGAIHLAWVDARDGGARVVYGRWSAQAQALEERVAVTSEVGGWARPALALNARGKPYLLMDRHAGTGAGEVWFAASAAPAAAAGWRYYE